MENTEKTNIEPEIISTELLNVNSLLVISKNSQDEYPVLSLRYQNQKDCRIHEKVLTKLMPELKIEHNDKMVAIFEKKGKFRKKHKLVSVYDLSRQEFVGTSNMHLHYEATKHQGAKVKTLGAKKK